MLKEKEPETAANILRCHNRLSVKWHPRNEHRNSTLTIRHYPDQAPVVKMLDSATRWIQQINIRENNCAIHWIEIYLVDRIIYLLNNWDQGSETSAVWNFYAKCHFMGNPMVALRNVCCFSGYQRDRDFVFPVLFFSLNCNILRYIVILAGGEDNLVF